MGRRILDFYKGQYTISGTVAAAYDACTGNPLAGWENGEWSSIMADLAELAAEYCDCRFAHQVIDEKLRPKLITDPESPLYGSVGKSAFENLEVLLALRHVDERCSAADVAIAKSSQPRMLTFGDWLTYNLVYINNGAVTATGVLITDAMPAILTNFSTTSTGANITPTGSASTTWQVEDLSPCESGTITIAAQVSPLPCCCCGTFINSARITADTPDCDPFNNASSTSNTLTGCLYLPIVMRNSP
jgi:uncharacterized repeat protein (TIGR01451 family)